jgi:hypothetical protein
LLFDQKPHDAKCANDHKQEQRESIFCSQSLWKSAIKGEAGDDRVETQLGVVNSIKVILPAFRLILAVEVLEEVERNVL